MLWIHLAPVCGTASRAREIRRFPGDPLPLRSDLFPEGRDDLDEKDMRRVQIANQLFIFACHIFQLACSKGIWATLENPKSSYFWATCWVLALLRSNEIFFAEFQVCMLGGSRDKWTRLVANFPEIQSLSIKCDKSHTHAPWGFAKDSEGKQVWATSLESAYPRTMCIALVTVVLQAAKREGLKLKANTLDEDVHPLHSAQNAQIHVGRQPRPSRMPPMVSDFAMVGVFVASSPNDIPCSLMSKLPRDITLHTKEGVEQLIPKHSRFLRFSALAPASEGGEVQEQSAKRQKRDQTTGTAEKVEVAFGLPWTCETFIQQACRVGHPLLRDAGLPPELLSAVHKHVEWNDLQMCSYRIAWCRRWVVRARELEVAEKKDAAERHPNVAEVTKNKRLLLTQEMLEEFGYEDVEVLRLLREGATLAGKVESSSAFEAQFKPGLLTIGQLEASAAQRNALVLRMTTPHEDMEVDKQLWEETCGELACGWAEGPFELEDLEPGATISRRFALFQKSKTRLIDDFSISGVNDSCEAHNKIDLHMVETFCSLVRCYFEACKAADRDSSILAKTYDLKNAYRQVPIHPAHYKYAYFSLYNVQRGRVEIYRLRTMPFGATHCVYSFLRLARALYAIATRGLFLMCTNFYDDFVLASRASLCESARNSMELVFELTGWLYARDGKKCTEFGKYCKALGVEFNFSRTKQGILAVCNTEARKSELVQQIADAVASGCLDKQQSLVLRGRLGFADSFLHGRLGRLVLSKLVEHAYGRQKRMEPDLISALKAMSDRLDRLQHAKPREVSIADNLQWFMYTDASFEGASCTGGLGGVLIDATGSVRQWFGISLDKEKCKCFGAEEKETIIYELEMAAAVVASGLWCNRQTNDLHVHFGDNDSVRFSFVRGSASGLVGQKLMEFQLTLEARSGSRTWYARVPTEANVSDFPSRLQEHSMLQKDHDVSGEAIAVLDKLLQTLCLDWNA